MPTTFLRLDTALTIVFVLATIGLWNTPILQILPIVVAGGIALGDFLTKRVPVFTVAICITLIPIVSIHLHTELTLIRSAVVITLLLFFNLCFRNRTKLIPAGDQLAVSLAAIIATTEILALTAGICAVLLIAKRSKNTTSPIAIPLAAYALSFTICGLTLFHTPVYQ